MAQFEFLKLPGEIRNQIYCHLLIFPPPAKPRPLGDAPVHLQILRVCKLVYEETRRIFYGGNTFIAHSGILTGLLRFRMYLDNISHPATTALISRYHIRVRLDCDPNYSPSQASDAISGVEELTIEVLQAQFGGSDYAVLKHFEGVRGVKRVRIYGSVTAFPGYINWLEESIATPKETVENFDLDRIPEGKIKTYGTWTVNSDDY